jgi:hypothetical protein
MNGGVSRTLASVLLIGALRACPQFDTPDPSDATSGVVYRIEPAQ